MGLSQRCRGALKLIHAADLPLHFCASSNGVCRICHHQSFLRMQTQMKGMQGLPEPKDQLLKPLAFYLRSRANAHGTSTSHTYPKSAALGNRPMPHVQTCCKAYHIRHYPIDCPPRLGRRFLDAWTPTIMASALWQGYLRDYALHTLHLQKMITWSGLRYQGWHLVLL